MFKNIQRNNKLLIVSDTAMTKTPWGHKAFGPVVKEVEFFLNEFESVTWIGFESEENSSLIELDHKTLKYIPLPKVGGSKLWNKVQILLNYPLMIYIIVRELFKHDRIHVRTPSNPGFITMILSFFFLKKEFWFKYAGSWIDKASKFYSFQREVLKLLWNNSKITVNGKWDNQKKNILAFENPCLNSSDRKRGELIIKSKEIKIKKDFCFVGALNEAKGVDLILSALNKLKDSQDVGTFYFVGGGVRIEEYKMIASKLSTNVVFLGFMSKDKIYEIYEKCQFIILPSKSEGFPKVIGEAMNYGVIPIVSDVSAIGQYIINKENGLLIKSLDIDSLNDSINYVLTELNEDKIENIIKANYKIARKFTYSYYINRMKKELFS